MAVVVALCLLGGLTQAASFHATSTTSAAVLDDAAADVGDVVPVEPITTVVSTHQTLTIVMPSLAPPIDSAFAPRTFRPPRG